jgi:hypothetical protein
LRGGSFNAAANNIRLLFGGTLTEKFPSRLSCRW